MADEIKDDDFMCHCSEEGKVQCEHVRETARAKALEGLNDEHREKYKNDDLWLVDALVYDLALDGELSFAADMWGGCYYKLHKLADGEWVEVDSCRIQCDSFVDGIAAVYLWKRQKEKENTT